MFTPTSEELSLLRTKPQLTKMHCSIYRPGIVLQARVNNASIAKGATTIPFDNITTGSYASVYYSSTCLVGTSPGARDKGTVYVYYATAGDTLIVGENDHIDWADNDYLTVLDYFELYPRYPSYEIDSTGFVSSKKAFDVSYVNQNTNLGQFICMGSHYANFIDGGSHQIFFSATGTVNVKGESMTYDWAFPGSTITGSSAHTPGWITYNNPGHYIAKLTVTSTSGEVNRGVRCISLYNRFGEGDIVPVQNWGIESFGGTRSEGGYRARIWVREDVDDIVDNALVILFYENWYGNTKANIHHSSMNRDNIFFVGYVVGSTIQIDYQSSEVSFDVASVTEIMKQGEAFSVSLEDSADPIASSASFGGSPWFFLDGLTVQTAVWHYLRWHSSFSYVADIQFIGNDHGAFVDKNIHYADFDRSSLYDAVQALVESAYYGKVVCDRQGKVWVERDLEATTNAASQVPLNMSLDGDDWINSPNITEKLVPSFSYIQLGAVAYTRGVSDIPYLSAAPGETPAYRGGKYVKEGGAVETQAELNSISGNIYAFRNSRFPSVSIPISGNYSNFDIAPKSIVRLYFNRKFRNLNWEGKPFLIDEVSWDYDPEKGSLLPTIRVAEATVGVAGDTIPIPELPPSEGQDQPPTTIQLPPFPEIPPFEFPDLGGVSDIYLNPHLLFEDSVWYDWLSNGSSGAFLMQDLVSSEIFSTLYLPAYTGNIYITPLIGCHTFADSAVGSYCAYDWVEVGGSADGSVDSGFSTNIDIPAKSSMEVYPATPITITVPGRALPMIGTVSAGVYGDQDRIHTWYGWLIEFA